MITIVKRFKTEASKFFRTMGENDAFRVTGDCNVRNSEVHGF